MQMQHLPRTAWTILVTAGIVTIALAALHHFGLCYAAGAVGAALLLMYVLRAEVGPRGWAAFALPRVAVRSVACFAAALLAFADAAALPLDSLAADAIRRAAQTFCRVRAISRARIGVVALTLSRVRVTAQVAPAATAAG